MLMARFRQIEIGALAENTLTTLQAPHFTAASWCQVCRNWDEVLELCRWNCDRTVDWEALRTLLWNTVPAEVLHDSEFEDLFTAILIALCGLNDGLEGGEYIFPA